MEDGEKKRREGKGGGGGAHALRQLVSIRPRVAGPPRPSYADLERRKPNIQINVSQRCPLQTWQQEAAPC